MTTSTRLKRTAVALSLPLVLAATAPASAAPAATDDIRVEIDTRYLETDWGVEIVYDKLAKKAETACRTPGRRTLSQLTDETRCMTTLLDSFVENTGHVGLANHHTRMTG